MEEIGVFDALTAFQEDRLNLFEVLFIDIEQHDVLFLEFILDNRTVKETFEGIQQFETAVDGVAVVEALSDHRGQTTFKFLDFGAEFVEIVIELLDFDIHDIVVERLELIHRFLEFLVNLLQGFSQRLAFSATQHDILKLGKLHNGVGQVQNIVATLHKTV
jgi:hypothetical protein